MQVQSEYPTSMAGVLAYVEAHKPGTVEFQGTEAETRRWRRAVKLFTPARSNVVLFPQPREAKVRQRRRRSSAARSSAKSGDSPSDPDPEPPAAERWRWAQPPGWSAFVASVWSRDTEHEIAAERVQGVAR
jgi:hypothetical protein